MKKAIAILLVLLVMTTLFSACGKPAEKEEETNSASSEVEGSEESKDPSAGKTELIFWHTWGEGAGLDAIKKVTDKYNEENEKNIFVKVDYVANKSSGNTQTMDKLMAAIAAGSPPDIALLDNFQVATWAAQNALVPMNELLEIPGETLDDVYPFAKAGSMYKGETYSIPYNSDTRALFYNKDMFIEAGLDPEKPPTTIAELEVAAEKLTVREGDTIVRAGFIPWLFAGRPIYTWGWSFGGQFYDAETNTLSIDAPENIKALQWEVDFAKKYGGQKFIELATSLQGGAQDAFVSGKVAMCVRGNFDIVNMESDGQSVNYGVTLIPSLNEGENISWAGGWGLTIPRGAANPDLSLDYMLYMKNAESQKIMSEMSGSLSIRNDGTNEAVFSDHKYNEQYAVFLNTLDVAFVRPPVPVGQKLWDDLGSALESALYEKDTPGNLLKAIQESATKELAEFD